MTDAVDILLAPEAWTFSNDEETVRRVRDAYVGYKLSAGATPDFDALRACIVGGFGGDVQAVLDFWDETMLADAPDRSDLDPSMRAQVEDLWRRRKVDAIVSALELAPLVEWERLSTSACLKAPDQMRAAADELERADGDGYSLVAFEVDDESAVATWNLRRKKGI